MCFWFKKINIQILSVFEWNISAKKNLKIPKPLNDNLKLSEHSPAKWKRRCEMLCFFNDSCVWLHTTVAGSKFPTQNVENTSALEHVLKFWCTPLWCETHFQVNMKKNLLSQITFWCRKIARLCREKYIWKSKCANHPHSGALFEIQMFSWQILMLSMCQVVDSSTSHFVC